MHQESILQTITIITLITIIGTLRVDRLASHTHISGPSSASVWPQNHEAPKLDAHLRGREVMNLMVRPPVLHPKRLLLMVPSHSGPPNLDDVHVIARQ